MIPLFIPALFGEHYQVLAQGQKAIACGIVVDTTDAARLFSILTRELMMPANKTITPTIAGSDDRQLFQTRNFYEYQFL